MTPQKLEQKNKKASLFGFLGPGLVAGAADDDPSGIATYSQAGAQFGYSLLWTVVLTWPFMVAVQLISARIGRVTGRGIAANLLEALPRSVTIALVLMLMAANGINIAADLAAMGEALQLVVGGGEHGHALVFGIVSAALQIYLPYRSYAPVLKWTTLALLSYVATVFAIHVPWQTALASTVWPDFSFDTEWMLVVVAVFGTTISPYLFFWQASQEVEEMEMRHRPPLRNSKRKARRELHRIQLDTTIGMAFSNIIAFFIMVTTAATLHANGVTGIQTSAQAAEALRPLAGDFAFELFALGIIGTGLLAVPVLAGSAAYAAADVLGWKASLAATPREAQGFYALIGCGTLVGVLIDFTPLDPIKMLFWSAVINGVISVPIIVAMMLLVRNQRVMKQFTVSPLLSYAGWSAALIMGLVVAALTWSSFQG